MVWRHLTRSSLLFLLLLSALPGHALAAPQGAADPSYQFLIGKLLAGEGAVPEALAAFEQTERLAPASPYVRIEHAELLARLAQVGRKPAQAGAERPQAGARVAQGRRLGAD